MRNFYCLLAHTKFIEQYTEFSPTAEMHDDVIDMASMGVHWGETQGLSDWLEGEYEQVAEEEDYEGERRHLNFRSAP